MKNSTKLYNYLRRLCLSIFYLIFISTTHSNAQTGISCNCSLSYPNNLNLPRSAVTFNESEVLRKFDPDSTFCGTLGGVIRVWYNDEHALTLGVRSVVVKTSSSTVTTSYTVAPTPSIPGCVDNPAVGSTILTGDQSGNDVANGGGRPLRPVLFITDLTVNGANSHIGDWQWGGIGISPSKVCGTWKAAVKTVDYTKSPAVTTITPDADPTSNNWSGIPDIPPGGFAALVNEGYGAEVSWDINSLGLLPGHTYRLQFIIHDGDQNKSGGDCGEGCTIIKIPEPMNIGDKVWYDQNNNGLQDAGEVGVPNTVIKLYNSASSLLQTTTTDINGIYSFNGLTPGSYYSGVVMPTGYAAGTTTTTSASPDNDNNTDNNGVTTVSGELRSNNITLISNNEPTTDGDGANGNLTLDFGLKGTGSIGDFVWNDKNGNGIQDSGEPGISGVTVILTYPNGSTINTTTDANGVYTFSNLAPGSYSVTFITPSGYTVSPYKQGADTTKDSNPVGGIANLVLSPGQNNTTIDAGFVCNGTHNVFIQTSCESYTWNGIKYTSGGTYTFAYTNGSGCPSVDTLKLRINYGSHNVFTQTSCESYTWNGIKYTSGGTFTFAYTNGSGCPSVDTLKLTVNYGSHNVSSQTVCESYLWNGTTYTTSGTYTFAYNNGSGCPSVDTLKLTVNYGTHNVSTQTVCESYLWNGTTYTTSGIYTFGYTNSSNCPSVDTLHLTVNYGTHNSFTQTVCESYSWDGITYTTSGIYTYAYSNEKDCPSVDTLHLTVNYGTHNVFSQTVCESYLWNGTTYTTSGIYTFGYTNSRNCPSVDTLHLTVNYGTHNSFTQTVCESYSWNGITYTTSGIYTYAYSNEKDCPSVDTLHLTVNYGSHNVSSQTVCESYLWNGTTYTTSGTYTFAYNNDSGCPSVDTLHLTVNYGTHNADIQTSCESYTWHGKTYTTNGIYTFAYENSFGCPSVDTLHLTVNYGTHNVYSQTICNSYTWNGLTYLASGIYTYSYTNEIDCPSVDTLYLTIINCTGRIGDFVWNDLDGNGIQDAGEPGISGDTVKLTYPDGSTSITLTDINGAYSFSSLPPGVFRLAFATPSDFVPSPSNAGSDDSKDSDPVGGVVDSITLSIGESNNTIDAGFAYNKLDIGDLVWYDQNNNGIQDPGDPVISGATVNLYTDVNGDNIPDGPPIMTTVTNLSGIYFFNNLAPGNYLAGVILPNGYIPGVTTSTSATPNNDNNDDNNGIHLVSGELFSNYITLTTGGEPANDAEGDGPNGNLTLDFGLNATSALGDRVWNDLNGNGIQDADEPGIEGVKVTLTYPSDSTLTTLTDSNGEYIFTNLAPGIYSIAFTTPAGFIHSPANQGSDDIIDSDPEGGIVSLILVNPNQVNLTVDAGFRSSRLSVGNFVWYDKNNNGIQDPGEPVISGDSVRLYSDANGDNIPDGAAIKTTVTNAGGVYSFTNLIPSNYIVGVTIPSGYKAGSVTATSATPNNNDNTDNNGVNTVNNELRSNFITLTTTGEPTTDGDDSNGNLTLDFGLTGIASIGDFVWNDLNHNGVHDAGEPGIQGVKVTLTYPDGADTISTLTDTSGAYNFSGLIGGSYSLAFETPETFKPSTPNAGTDDTIDSDPVSGLVNGIALANGENNNTIDAGFVKLITLSGNVWHDVNALIDNLVNNSGVLQTPPAAAIPIGLRAYLVNNNTGLIEKIALIPSATGVFTFTNVTSNTNYYIILSSNAGFVGSTPPIAKLPAGWVNVGEKLGITPGSDGIANGRLNVPVLQSNIINANFGIRLGAGASKQ